MNFLEARRNREAPKNFQDNYYIYYPSLPAAIVALVIWIVILSAIVYRSRRFKIWYLTVLIVGLLSMSLHCVSILISEVEAIGYVMRIYGHFHLNRYNPYVIMQAFTVKIYRSELI